MYVCNIAKILFTLFITLQKFIYIYNMIKILHVITYNNYFVIVMLQNNIGGGGNIIIFKSLFIQKIF